MNNSYIQVSNANTPPLAFFIFRFRKFLILLCLLVDSNFTSVWECLHGELNEIASIHSTFMKKINEEVESPIRNISTSDDWVKVKEVC